MKFLLLHPLSNKTQIGGVKIGKKEYPLSVTYDDGLQVRVSRPIADRIVIIVPIASYLDEELSQAPLAEWMQLLMSGLKNTPECVSEKYSPSAKLFTEVTLELGPSKSAVHVSLYGPKAIGKKEPWRLRLEFCPSKLGKAECIKLNQLLIEASLGLWNLADAATEAHVTLLDVAVDIVGVEPAHILVRNAKARKSVQYRGEDGALETEYGAPKKKKGAGEGFGDPVFRLYDKRRQLIASGVKPPFGDVPISRVEVRRRWTSNQPLLHELSSLTNMFSDTYIAYLRTGSEDATPSWRRYAYERRFFSAKQCREVYGYPEELALKLEKMMRRFAFSAFDRDVWWTHWESSLKDHHLDAIFFA